MARQTFTTGQRVYIKRWGTTRDAAIVRNPEVAKGYDKRKTIASLCVSLPLSPQHLELLAQGLFVDFEPRSEYQRRERRKLYATLTGNETPIASFLPDRDGT